MTGSEVYKIALDSLGYQGTPGIKQRALTIINQIYLELHRLVYNSSEFTPIETLNDKIDLPLKTIISAMSAGVAEKIALGNGDGELQQYFAIEYVRQKNKINSVEQVVDILK